MSKDGTIRSWSIIDIEKYHKGLLSPKEMHDLEKAALDDPFLADALEGYAAPGINASADIAGLKKRLLERTDEDRKVIPLIAPPHSSFPWLRAAAMFIVVLGAGFLVYHFGFNKNSSPIAKSEVSNKSNVIPDSGNSNYVMPGTEKEISSPAGASSDSLITQHRTNTAIKQKEEPEAQQEIIALPDTIASVQTFSDLGNLKKEEQEAIAPPPINATITTESLEKKVNDENRLRRQNQFAKERRELPIKEGKAEDTNFGIIQKPDTTAIANKNFSRDAEPPAPFRGNAYAKQSNAASENVKDNNAGRINVFRGQVVDADNNVVPFANITNTADNIGTYTDAKGNFTLTSPDSVLNVQIRSLGYENNNLKLNNQQLNNQVVMQEDRSLREVVISQKKVNSTRSRTSTMVLEEPEPVDGWTNYDSYLANNLIVPETYKSRQTDGGSVTLSFEVNSKGQPVNITVDKSLCESCDKEAIRLVKQGPKWKRKSRKGRTTVTITF